MNCKIPKKREKSKTFFHEFFTIKRIEFVQEAKKDGKNNMKAPLYID